MYLSYSSQLVKHDLRRFIRQHASTDDLSNQNQGLSQRKVQDFLATPFDYLVVGPRLGAGGLKTLPSRLSNIQDDVARLSSILQSPGDFGQKQQQIREEIETRLVETLEAGSEVEEQVFNTIKDRLPENVVQVISDLRSSTASPGNVGLGAGADAPAGSLPSFSSSSKTYSSQSLSNDDININIAAGELQQLSDTIGELKNALDAAVDNDVQANKAMLKMNVAELKDRLAKELDELQPGVTSQTTIAGAPVSAAVDEARALLADTNSFLKKF